MGKLLHISLRRLWQERWTIHTGTYFSRRLITGQKDLSESARGKRRVKTWFTLLIICFLLSGWAKEIGAGRAIGIVIMKILEQVEWQDEDQLTALRVGVLGNDEELIKTLKEFAPKTRIRNKPIVIVQCANINQINQLQVLMICKELNQEIEPIRSRLIGTGTLLMTQESNDRSGVMINFIKDDNRLAFEVNRKNILNEKISISNKLIVLGGTDLELTTMFDETQQSLKSSQNRAKKLEQELKTGQEKLALQASQIEKSESMLKSKQMEIDRSQTKIQEQNNIISTQNNYISKQKDELLKVQKILENTNKDLTFSQQKLTENQKTLEEKRQELADKFYEISNLESRITKDLEILEKLNHKIKTKEQELSHQSTTIKKQQKLMLITFIILSLTAGMGFLTYLNLRLKKKSAQLLEEKNRILVQQQEEIRRQGVRLVRQNDELELLDKVVEAMNSKTWLSELEKSLLEHAMSLFITAEKACLLSLDMQSKEFLFAEMIGYDKDSTKDIRIPYEEALARYTKGSLILEEGVYLIKNFVGLSGEARFMGHPRPLVMLAMTIEQDDLTHSILILDNFSNIDAFCEADISRLKRFRAHAVSALGKARLLDQLNRAHDDLEHANRALTTANQQLEKNSLTDYMTGLRNRRYLQQMLPKDVASVVRGYRSFALGMQPLPPENGAIGFILLDLDFFKQVNDGYGHDAGDRVLKQLARLLETVSREADIVVRWGGEEFLLVTVGFNPNELSLMAERVRAAVEAHVFDLGNGQTIKKTCSIGCVAFPFFPKAPNAISWEQTLMLADQGLYTAKHSGRNAWVIVHSTALTEVDDFITKANQSFGRMVKIGELRLESSLDGIKKLQLTNSKRS